MKIKKLNKNIVKNNNPISEVFGTIMLIVISVTLFSSIYATVLSTDIPDSRPANHPHLLVCWQRKVA